MSAQKCRNLLEKPKNSQGFILFEALLAMTLITGVWAVSFGAYQSLALKMTQEETKRVELRKAFDAFEAQEQARTRSISPNKAVANESTRVSSRHRAVRNSAQSTFKEKR